MWIILATTASMFWGMQYILSEQLFKHISVLTTVAVEMFFVSLIVGAVALYEGVFTADIIAISSSSRLLWLICGGTVTWLVGELGISYAIQDSNATLAGLIEISYPLFIALFAYVFFRESELSLGTAVGGLLVFAGVCTIYWFSR
jgi:drug/metabolite transporter (DMT)-like permease